jgi:calcineurin-like phosphoesterase family protein
MDSVIIQNHNALVGIGDTVIHLGDFTLRDSAEAEYYIKWLNGYHVFLEGSHDRWLKKKRALQIWEKSIEGIYVVACHYAMRTWAKSHYNSWQLYGHSHSTLPPVGKQWDVGVDNNDFYPVSFSRLKEIMETRPDNPNLVK